jgi:hypothetical protein
LAGSKSACPFWVTRETLVPRIFYFWTNCREFDNFLAREGNMSTRRKNWVGLGFEGLIVWFGGFFLVGVATGAGICHAWHKIWSH